MLDLAFLNDHIDFREGPEKFKPLKSPFALRGWACATNHKHLVAVRNAKSGLPALPAELADTIRPLLRVPKSKPLVTTLGELREWCSLRLVDACENCNDTGWVPCWYCDGTGKRYQPCEKCSHDHLCSCDDCEGFGKDYCPRHERGDRPGDIHGVRLYRKELGFALDHRLPRGKVSVYAHEAAANGQRDKAACLIVRGAGFLVIVMACENDDPAPTFPGRKAVAR